MDPYYFPFDIVEKDDLVIGNKYYITLNNNVIKNFLDKKRKLPVSHLSGTFIRLQKVNKMEFAVFKNIHIINKNYKSGSCLFMLVQHPNNIFGITNCDDFTQESEVYLSINKWIFGNPSEQKILQQKALSIINNNLNNDTTNITSEFIGTKKQINGGTKRKNKYQKNSKKNSNKVNRKNKTIKNKI